MKLANIIITLASTIVSASSHKCHACFEGICYYKTRIVDENRFSGQLAIDRTENIVYFHYEDKSLTDHTAAFDLDDIRFKMIPGIDFSFARAVDQTTRNVYIGGAHGIYKYNPIDNTTSSFGLFDKTIWHMQFKNKVYYTVFKTNGLFTLENKQSKPLNPLSNFLIDDFVIDFQEDIYFLSQGKVYRLKKGANSVSLFANDSYSLSIDKNEVAHFMHSGKRGLYKLDKKTDGLVEVGVFGNGLPLRSVFDNNNNVIFHENHSRKLFYLMPNYGRCLISQRARVYNNNHNKSLQKVADTEAPSFLVFSQVS